MCDTFFGLAVVPQKWVYIIQRFGKYYRTLQPGLSFTIPCVDHIAYKVDLRETLIDIAAQSAVTKDNVSITLDGLVYIQVTDAYDSVYNVSDVKLAITQLAQTAMRSEIGKLDLDETFKEREILNERIVEAINGAAANWGARCFRYEIKDIFPTGSVLSAMNYQAEAERRKRATILQSEGAQQAAINQADGQKRAVELASQGEATARINRANAAAMEIKLIAEQINKTGGKDAVSLELARKYLASFEHLAKKTNTLILPQDATDVSGIVAKAYKVFEGVSRGVKDDYDKIDEIKK